MSHDTLHQNCPSQKTYGDHRVSKNREREKEIIILKQLLKILEPLAIGPIHAERERKNVHAYLYPNLGDKSITQVDKKSVIHNSGLN
jgi:hypothetical protein